MNTISILLSLSAAFICSAVLTGFMRKYAVKRNVLDVPNARSSHTVPTPRGGGLAFAAAFLISTICIRLNYVDLPGFLPAIWGGALVAYIGWIDDKKRLPAGTRVIIHFIAATWGICWLGGLPSLDLGFTEVHFGNLGYPIAIVGTVWMINLYNFMDGIDGLAAGEAASVSAGAAFLFVLSGNGAMALLCLFLTASTGGFLIFNWPPAKMFMGDTGSGFLGYIFAMLAIISERTTSIHLLVWAVLLAVFVTDATATLIKRILQGKRPTEAHREHAYQIAVQKGLSHKETTIGILSINLLIFVLTVFSLKHIPESFCWVAIAIYSSMIFIWFIIEFFVSKGEKLSLWGK